jgi:hypothetical protein
MRGFQSNEVCANIKVVIAHTYSRNNMEMSRRRQTCFGFYKLHKTTRATLQRLYLQKIRKKCSMQGLNSVYTKTCQTFRAMKLLDQALLAKAHQIGEYPDAGKRSQDNKEREEFISLHRFRGEKEIEEGAKTSKISGKRLHQTGSSTGAGKDRAFRPGFWEALFNSKHLWNGGQF